MKLKATHPPQTEPLEGVGDFGLSEARTKTRIPAPLVVGFFLAAITLAFSIGIYFAVMP